MLNGFIGSTSEGASLLQIARGLEADGILTAAGKAKWRPETLKKILQNEKYIGDALLQKTYTVDFLSKRGSKITASFPVLCRKQP